VQVGESAHLISFEPLSERHGEWVGEVSGWVVGIGASLCVESLGAKRWEIGGDEKLRDERGLTSVTLTHQHTHRASDGQGPIFTVLTVGMGVCRFLSLNVPVRASGGVGVSWYWSKIDMDQVKEYG
jgi:hypothetical protein